MNPPVDFDRAAAEYDRRYEENRYSGIGAVVEEFAAPGHVVLEVGCGTGHWIAGLESRDCRAVGLDPSAGMLRRALGRVESGLLVRGAAEALPFRAGSFDRLAVINALHHFDDPVAFVRHARRVLRPGGRIVVMGLDPSRGSDEWFVYDFFPGTLERDRARYSSTGGIVEWLENAGFVDCSSRVGHRITFDEPARDYLEHGRLTKHSASQLALLGDVEYAAGVERIRRAIRAAEARGEELRLRGELSIYATFGTVGG